MARHTPVDRRHHYEPVPRLPMWGSMRHTAHYCYVWTSPMQAGDGSVHVDPPCPRNEQPCVGSLGSAFPLLAQKVLELVHQLLRVEVVVTGWAPRRVTRRVIVLL